MPYTPPAPETCRLFIDSVSFNQQGLVAAIAQQHDTHMVLMLAWMNRQALEETLLTGQVCYFSRSRNRLWRKGETSGQLQRLVEARLDCDGDTLLLLVEQEGVACHTGRTSCFYKRLTPDGLLETEAPRISPEKLYGRSHD